MLYKDFKDIKLSRLGMGNMRLPTKMLGAKIDVEKAGEIIDYAMENGVNYYDTAWIYHLGKSENFLGNALKKYPRDSFYIADKYFMVGNPDYKKVFETQLKKLQTDHIDFYLIHCIVDATAKLYLSSGCVEYFKEQKAKGRIKYLGFSSHASPKTLKMFAEYTDWDFAQIQLNYFDWFYGTAREQYKILNEKNIPIMVMEPVRGGKLATLNSEANNILNKAHPDWSIPSWAFRFVRNLSGVQVILSGMSTLDQIKDNVSTFSDDTSFSIEDEETLRKACEIYHKKLAVPCTACRYCCDNCPKKINIPEYLNAYNDYKNGNKVDFSKVNSEGKADECINCKKCAEHCPQSINIPSFMSEISKIK